MEYSDINNLLQSLELKKDNENSKNSEPQDKKASKTSYATR